MKDATIEDKPEAAMLLFERRVGLRPDQKLLRLAVIEGGCNKTAMRVLAYAARFDRIPMN